MKIVSNFVESLKELMLYENLTNDKLGKAIGLSKETVSHWKNGKNDIHLSNALKLADYFNCSLEFLMGRTTIRLSYTPKPCPPFYQRLLEVMKERGKTYYQVVEKEKFLSDSNLTNWKNGGDPFFYTVIKLANYFGYTLDAFVGRE